MTLRIERAWLHVFGATQQTGEQVVVMDGPRFLAILGDSMDPESTKRAEILLAALQERERCTTSPPSTG